MNFHVFENDLNIVSINDQSVVTRMCYSMLIVIKKGK